MPNSIIKSFAKKSGKSIDEVEALWDKAKKIALKNGLPEGTDAFYAYVSGILKKMLKVESKLNTDPEDLLEDYTSGTKWRLRSEPMNSSSTIFKRDTFLRRRSEKDKKKVVSGVHKKAKSSKEDKEKDS